MKIKPDQTVNETDTDTYQTDVQIDKWLIRPTNYNGTACFKDLNNCLNKKIYSYLETSGGQSSNLYLNVVYFFNASVN